MDETFPDTPMPPLSPKPRRMLPDDESDQRVPFAAPGYDAGVTSVALPAVGTGVASGGVPSAGTGSAAVTNEVPGAVSAAGTAAVPSAATGGVPGAATEAWRDTQSIPKVLPQDSEAAQWTRFMPAVPAAIPAADGTPGPVAGSPGTGLQGADLQGADLQAAGWQGAGPQGAGPYDGGASRGAGQSEPWYADADAAPRRRADPVAVELGYTDAAYGGARDVGEREQPRGSGAVSVPPDGGAAAPDQRIRAKGDGGKRGGKPGFWHTKHRRAKIVVTIILALALALVGTAAGYGVALNNRVNRAGVSAMLPSDQPSNVAPTSTVQSLGDPYAGRAVNILVIGSDSRAGDNASVSNDVNIGQRSDTTFIMHISADRTRLDVVSIPRDILITIPNCVYDDQSKVTGSGYTKQKFNAAFSYGSSGSKGTTASGVACTIRAVNQMSNNTVPIDAYVVVDFAGFVNIINAIGGVDIWLPCAVSSPNANNLKLPSGLNHLDGDTAVQYARAREGKGLGDGSDLMRIQRQQALFMAIANKVLGMNVMTNIPTLYNFVGSLADSVTTNLGNIVEIAGFAYSLRNLPSSAITFMTIPIADAGDGANVILVPSRDNPVWQALASDTPIADTGAKTNPVGPADATPTPSQASPSAGPPPGVVSAPLGQCGK